MVVISKEESDKAKEERLREKLKRKAEELKKEDTNKATNNISNKQHKPNEANTTTTTTDKSSNKKSSTASSTIIKTKTDTCNNSNEKKQKEERNSKRRDNRNRSRGRSQQHSKNTNMMNNHNHSYGGPPPHGYYRGNPGGGYRNSGDRYGRGGGAGGAGDWRPPPYDYDYPHHHHPYGYGGHINAGYHQYNQQYHHNQPYQQYQGYDRNGGAGGWSGSGGGYDGYDYDNNGAGYWRDGPTSGSGGPNRYDYDRRDSHSPRGRNNDGGGGAGAGSAGSKGGSPRRSRSKSHHSEDSYSRSTISRSKSASRSRSRSRSHSRRSRSRSSSTVLSSSTAGRSRSSSSDRSLSRSPSQHSRSKSRSPTNDKKRRSRSHGSSDDDGGDSKKSRSASTITSGAHNNTTSTTTIANGKLTKDQRTIFVSQLVMKTEERDIKKYFRKKLGCKVNDVQLLRDRRTGRHKGCAYVELGRLEDVRIALAASGSIPGFQRFPILVKASEAEKNYGLDGGLCVGGSIVGGATTMMTTTSTVTAQFPLSSSTASAPAATIMTGSTISTNGLNKRIEAQKVYIGNIDRNVTQAQLYTIFCQFGDLEKVTLQVDTATGISKGYAFLSFKDPKVANLAIQCMAGQVLASRPMRTGWANLNTSIPNLEEVSSSEFPDDAVERIEKVNKIFTKLNSTGLAPLPGLCLIPGMSKMDQKDLMKQVDDPIRSSCIEAPSMSTDITSAAEAALNAAFGMTPLPSSLNQVSITSSNQSNVSSEPNVPQDCKEDEGNVPVSESIDNPKIVKGVQSRNILVRNMFDKDEETEEGWEEDIQLDFEEESSKHGKIISVKVMSKEEGGKIYASFETIDGAKACAENLAGRWFDKRQLTVEFISEDLFNNIEV